MINSTPKYFTGQPTVRCTCCKHRFESEDWVVISDKLKNKYFCNSDCLAIYLKAASYKLIKSKELSDAITI